MEKRLHRGGPERLGEDGGFDFAAAILKRSIQIRSTGQGFIPLLCILTVTRVSLVLPEFLTFLNYSIFRVGWSITKLRMLNRPNLYPTQFKASVSSAGDPRALYEQIVLDSNRYCHVDLAIARAAQHYDPVLSKE